jgi:hypothetical protein
MLKREEIKTEVNSLLRMQTYWIKNNSLNFIDKILRDRPLTKKQSDVLLKVKKSIEEIKIDYWQTHLNFDSICDIKKHIAEIKKYF